VIPEIGTQERAAELRHQFIASIAFICMPDPLVSVALVISPDRAVETSIACSPPLDPSLCLSTI
jgi:hypothetical protein